MRKYFAINTSNTVTDVNTNTQYAVALTESVREYAVFVKNDTEILDTFTVVTNIVADVSELYDVALSLTYVNDAEDFDIFIY